MWRRGRRVLRRAGRSIVAAKDCGIEWDIVDQVGIFLRLKLTICDLIGLTLFGVYIFLFPPFALLVFIGANSGDYAMGRYKNDGLENHEKQA